MANFYRDNPDLIFAFKHAPWDQIVPLVERDYKEAEVHEEAPTDAAEALESYQMVLELVGRIAADDIAPHAEEVDQVGLRFEGGEVTYAPPTQQQLRVLYENGLMGLTLPREFGGQNLPTVLSSAAHEMVARADASFLTLFALQGCAETINFFANEDLRAKYVPRAIEGDTMAMVLTEPNAGSDLGSARTRAEPTDEEGVWEITGQKCFITNGCGDILLVLARTEPDSADARGLSLFIVEKGPGVMVERIESKLGIHGSPTCVLRLDKARGHLVGKRKFGLSRYVMQLMFGARLGISAQALGIMTAATKAARLHAEVREQFGRPISKFPPVAEMLVTMQTLTEASRALVYEVSGIVDYKVGWEKRQADAATDDERAEARQMVRHFDGLGDCLTPLCKWFTCEWVQHVCYLAMQVHGGYGYMKEYGVERLYRDARITSIYEGTSQIQAGHAGPKIVKGVLDDYIDELHASCPHGELQEQMAANREAFKEVQAHLRETGDQAYRRLCDWAMAGLTTDLLCGYYLLRQVPHAERKQAVAQKFIAEATLRIQAARQRILSGERTTLEHYDTIMQ